MPTKDWRLLARDLSFYVSGRADVAAADWHADPWVYPLDWTFQLDREDEYFAPKDDEGIPLRAYPEPIGTHYLPSRIAGYGFAHWNRWSLRGDTLNRDGFLRVAGWFLHSSSSGRYEYDIAVAGKTPPWISCIAQGEAASILVRAERLTGERGYGEAARRAAHWLLVPERDGGVQSTLPDGRPFLEEYPLTRYRHVLNGCLYAVVGLSDLCRHGDSREERAPFHDLLRRLIESLENNLPAWDARGWSTYDYCVDARATRNLNTMTYQTLQVVLLRYLADQADSSALRAMAERWSRSAQRLPMRMQALGRKMAYRIVSGW